MPLCVIKRLDGSYHPFPQDWDCVITGPATFQGTSRGLFRPESVSQPDQDVPRRWSQHETHPCAGPLVHLPDFTFIPPVGQAGRLGTQAGRGAGLSVSGPSCSSWNQGCERLAAGFVQADPHHQLVLRLRPGFDRDDEPVWQGVRTRPPEAPECSSLMFSPGPTGNFLPGLFLH